MSWLKHTGTDTKGNMRLLKEYGGNAGSSPMARQKYAKGGVVQGFKDGGNPALDEGMAAADGQSARPSLAKPAKKGPGKNGKKEGTTVNIIIAGKGPDAGMPHPAMGAPGPGGPAPAMVAPRPMPLPGAGPVPAPGPGGPGGPPMLNRRYGGAVGKFAKGGKVRSNGDGDGKIKANTKGDESSKIAKKETHGADPYAKGGKVSMKAFDKEEAQERKEFMKTGKHEDDCYREGGPVMGLHNSQGGAGGAKGRLAKIKMYGK